MKSDDWKETDEHKGSRHIDPEEVGKLVLVLVLISLASAGVYYPIRHVKEFGGMPFSCGIVFGLIGSGTAAWCGLRFKSRLCDIALLLSIPALSYWGWVVYQLIYHI